MGLPFWIVAMLKTNIVGLAPFALPSTSQFLARILIMLLIERELDAYTA